MPSQAARPRSLSPPAALAMSPSGYLEGASLLEASARLPVASLAVASALGLNDIMECSRCDRMSWRGRLRWRVALAASRDPLWATLALEEDIHSDLAASLPPTSSVSSGAIAALSSRARPSLARSEVLRCSERAELQGSRPSLLRALLDQPDPESLSRRREEAIAALVDRISRRQPWRFLEVVDGVPQLASHPILALLAPGRELDGPLEDALAVLTDQDILEEAGRHREARLSACPAICEHRAVCSSGPRCGRVEAYPGQFIACGLCDEAFYCGPKCRLAHWSADHQACCRGALAASAEGDIERIEREEAAIVAAAEAAAAFPSGGHSESRAEISGRPCPDCAKERRQLIAPLTAAAATALNGAWGGDWHALGAWPRQPPAVLALAAATSELLEAAAGDHPPQVADKAASEIWTEFRQRAMRDAHTLVAQMHSFPDAIAAGTMPPWVWKHAEARVKVEFGPSKDSWRAVARRAAPVGGRAAEALAGWLVAVLRAAAEAPPLPLRERLRTVASYRRVDVEAAVGAICRDRPFTPALLRMLGRLANFVEIPSGLLLRHVDLGGSPEAAELLLKEAWIPSSGLDSSPLAQICLMPSASACLLENVASRTVPDGNGMRALHRLSGEVGARGQIARNVAARWATLLPREAVAAAVGDTPLEVPELSTDDLTGPGSELPDLEALTQALTAPWLEGMRLHGDSARRVYTRRPLTADSVRVVKLATQGMETEEVESLLADVEPCLVRHNSRGVVALFHWLGASEPRPVFIRLLHSLVQTAPTLNEKMAAGAASSQHRHLVAKHSRASVEAVEFLLSACPRLARSTLPVEQLGLLPPASVGSGIAAETGVLAATAGGGAADAASSGTIGLGRLLPLQTLCLRCEAPDNHSALIARALLKRSPEARDHPLPRALRRNARGSKYNIFICSAATCLQQRRLAAEEAGEDASLLREMQEILARAMTCSSSGSSSTAMSTLAMPPLTHGSPAVAQDAASSAAATVPQPLRPPRDPPPPRRSPRLGRHCEPPAGPPPRTLCQAMAARAARGLPPLNGSSRFGGELHLQGCGVARYAEAASALPAIRAQ